MEEPEELLIGVMNKYPGHDLRVQWLSIQFDLH
jgi:hypothetical protein